MRKNKNWSLLFYFLKKRTFDSFENPKYVLYFVFIIILVGSFGLISDLFKLTYCISCKLDSEIIKSFTFNMTNIGLSLVAASVIDLIFISKKNIKKENLEQKHKNIDFQSIKGNVRFFGLTSLILSFIFWIFANNLIENNYWKIIIATISLLFSYWIWWISNVRNKILSNSITNLSAIIGGIPNEKKKNNNTPKEELKGNISGFKTE